MRIAVCIKQVPDTEARIRIAADGRWIEEEDMPFVVNESDSYALEEALQIAERSGGEVLVISLGPARVKEALRKCLALGATSAIHLEDDAFSGGDAAANARALAAVVEREKVDLVLSGSQSADLGFGATTSILAGYLGWPHAWLVMGVEIEEGGASAKVTREMEAGLNELFRISLPAVIEVQAGINHPRYASLKGIMKAKRKPISSPTAAELGLEDGTIGTAGSRVRIVDIALPESAKGAVMLEGEPQQMAAELVERLSKEARVL